ncbi:hypothetical protein QTO34_012030 [Cnephaeus nilssonii]|uniref:Uncharacterized protein n=1 Tax=Cnephaeus nilssonii TaxID=3371016 RepID=A0AA40LDT5_CNENI|nr:hypothetical protein QTO34_012030 [Eptesicus nilssonii]
MQTQRGAAFSLGRAEASPGGVGSTQDAREAAPASERSLNRALWELPALGSTRAVQTLSSGLPGEPLPGLAQAVVFCGRATLKEPKSHMWLTSRFADQRVAYDRG